MGAKWKIWPLLLLLCLMLSGCGLRTLEELYCLPKRSEDTDTLQSLIDDAMEELTYCAPVSGEHRQSMQTADLDGDGEDEYLVFAKDDSENPLKILIFSQVASGYVLMDTIEGYGFDFEFVDFVQMDDRDGLEIVVGRLVSEELPRSVSVYRFTSGYAKQLLSTGYNGLVCQDLNGDGRGELMLFTAGISERGKGMAVLYTYQEDQLQRSHVSYLSQPISYFLQSTSGMLEDGSQAVFVTGSDENHNMVLDIFCVNDANVVRLSTGMTIPSVHNYLIYPEDFDEDGVVEIPIPVALEQDAEANAYILKWSSLDKLGNYYTKGYTYHHHAQGWYISLEESWIDQIAITQENGAVSFWKKTDQEDRIGLFTIYTLTDSDRESEAILENKIVLFKGDSIVYAVQLGEYAQEEGITEAYLQGIFHPIRKEWNTEEDGV